MSISEISYKLTLVNNNLLLLSQTTLTLSAATVAVNTTLNTTFATILLEGTDVLGTLSISSDPSNFFNIANGNELQLDNTPTVGNHSVTIRYSGNTTKDFVRTIEVTAISYTNIRSFSLASLSNSYYIIPIVTLNKFGSAFSVSGWFKKGVTANSMMVMNRVINAGFAYYILMKSTGEIDFIVSQDGTATRSRRTTPTYDDNLWHHVVCTFKANVIKIYVDGAEPASTLITSNTVNTILASPTQIWIGANNITTPNNKYTGLLDEISLWNIEMTSAQVTETYNSGVPTDLSLHSVVSNLRGWYRAETPDTDNAIFDHAGISSIVSTSGYAFSGDVPT